MADTDFPSYAVATDKQHNGFLREISKYGKPIDCVDHRPDYNTMSGQLVRAKKIVSYITKQPSHQPSTARSLLSGIPKNRERVGKPKGDHTFHTSHSGCGNQESKASLAQFDFQGTKVKYLTKGYPSWPIIVGMALHQAFQGRLCLDQMTT